MSFFEVSYEKGMVEDFKGTGGFLAASGIYKVKLKKIIADVTKNGAQVINLMVTDEHGENQRMLFQAFILVKKDGEEYAKGRKGFNQLCVVCGVKGTLADPEAEMVQLGKNSAPTEQYVIKELEDYEVYLHVKNEYSVYNGEIQERKNVLNVFRVEDYASSEEIVFDANTKGKQYEYEIQNAKADILRDNLTEEDITAYLNKRRGGAKTETKDNKPSKGFAGRFGK